MKNIKIFIVAILTATAFASCSNPSSISVTTPPTKMEYRLGEAFDPAGMVVTATYNDGDTAAVTVGTDNFTYDFSTAGTKTVTVTYKGKAAQVTGILVTNKVYGPEATVLGHGYDVTLRYAYSPDIKQSVLDFARLEAAGWITKDNNLREGQFETTEGGQISEVSESLGVQAGVSGGGGAFGVSFQSEISSYYNQKQYTKDSYAFAMSTSRITSDAWYVQNRKDPARLRQYLSKNFLEDIGNKTPQEIISLYGTHVMLGGIWGARLDYRMSAKRKIESYASGYGVSFSAYVEASAMGVTANAGVSSAVDREFAQNFEKNSLQVNTTVIGGDPQYAQLVHTYKDYTKWVETVAGKEVWCDYYPESLVPIADLIEDADIRANLQAAVDDYFKSKQITVTTALKRAQTSQKFTIRGDRSTVSFTGDDDEVNFEKDPQRVWMTVALSKTSDGNINANFVYDVEEVVATSGRTRLTLRKDVKVVINRDNFTIDEKPLAWSFPETTYQPRSYPHQWLGTNVSGITPCPFISLLYIAVDGPGSSDTGNIGLQGTFNIDYSYME